MTITPCVGISLDGKSKIFRKKNSGQESIFLRTLLFQSSCLKFAFSYPFPIIQTHFQICALTKLLRDHLKGFFQKAAKVFTPAPHTLMRYTLRVTLIGSFSFHVFSKKKMTPYKWQHLILLKPESTRNSRFLTVY